jgi:hypothetical protein
MTDSSAAEVAAVLATACSFGPTTPQNNPLGIHRRVEGELR